MFSPLGLGPRQLFMSFFFLFVSSLLFDLICRELLVQFSRCVILVCSVCVCACSDVSLTHIWLLSHVMDMQNTCIDCVYANTLGLVAIPTNWAWLITIKTKAIQLFIYQ